MQGERRSRLLAADEYAEPIARVLRIIGTALAFECVDSYLKAKFIATEERFVRRLNKVKAIEKQYMPAVAATTLAT